jgi:hypothetical protein
MIQKLGWYIDERGNMKWGWIEPHQLWLPFEHLDFLWCNLKRSEESFFRSRI